MIFFESGFLIQQKKRGCTYQSQKGREDATLDSNSWKLGMFSSAMGDNLVRFWPAEIPVDSFNLHFINTFIQCSLLHLVEILACGTFICSFLAFVQAHPLHFLGRIDTRELQYIASELLRYFRVEGPTADRSRNWRASQSINPKITCSRSSIFFQNEKSSFGSEQGIVGNGGIILWPIDIPTDLSWRG